MARKGRSSSPSQPPERPAPSGRPAPGVAGGPATSLSAGTQRFLHEAPSYVICIIFVLILRAFVVQAFVIPTCSMAPGLNGKHYEMKCAACGYHYHVGFNPPGQQVPRAPTVHPVCPLCFSTQVTDDDQKRETYLGDRILATDFIYDFIEPRRWDVFVFKFPNAPAQNYIKRLVGLPGEEISINHGDLYINHNIARKPDRVQERLWLPVYDSDFWDRRHQPRWRPEGGANGPGVAGSASAPSAAKTAAWNAGGWSYAARSDDPQQPAMPIKVTAPAGGAAWLTYHHLNRAGQEGPISDFYGYDVVLGQETRPDGMFAVTDLALLAELELESPGVVELVLRAYGDTFTYIIPSFGAGREVTILHNGRLCAIGYQDLLPIGKKVRLEASNVDHAVTLKLNGRRIVRRSITSTGPRSGIVVDPPGKITEADDYTYEPTLGAGQSPGDLLVWNLVRNWDGRALRVVADRPVPGLKPVADLKLGLRGGRATVRRLAINRDVYYTSDILGRPANQPGAAVGGRPYKLAADQFFALGDNSPMSGDSRWWATLPGESPVVPRANIIGKALAVFWPAGGPRYYIPVPVIPDVTEMRMVR